MKIAEAIRNRTKNRYSKKKKKKKKKKLEVIATGRPPRTSGHGGITRFLVIPSLS